MFDTWLKQEQAAIRSRFEAVRILCILVTVFMVISSLTQVISFLDGGGVLDLVLIVIYVIGIVFALSVSNYKKRFIEPFLASVRQELTTEEMQETFARQMMEEAKCIVYQPLPGIKECELMAAADYCYMRQPRKCRIIQNRRMRRLVLSKEEYMVGRGHMRWCYGLALYASDNENPVWKGYFMRQEEAEQAFRFLQNILPPEAVVQDELSNPPKGSEKPLWKELLDLWPAVVLIALMYGLYRWLGG